MRKMNRPQPKYNQFQKWSVCISTSNFRPFLQCIVEQISPNPKFEVKWCQNKENQQTMTKILSILKVLRIHQHDKFHAIPPMHSQENAWKLQISPVSLSQNVVKMRKINRPWPKSNQFWKWSGYITKLNFRPLRVTAIRSQVRNYL